MLLVISSEEVSCSLEDNECIYNKMVSQFVHAVLKIIRDEHARWVELVGVSFIYTCVYCADSEFVAMQVFP